MADNRQQTDKDTTTADGSGRRPGSMRKSMHDGVAVWCDCCSCEMEPYWADIAREMEKEHGSDAD